MVQGKPFIVLPYSTDASRPAERIFVRSHIIAMDLDYIEILSTTRQDNSGFGELESPFKDYFSRKE